MVNHRLEQPWLVNFDDLKHTENDFYSISFIILCFFKIIFNMQLREINEISSDNQINLQITI